MPGDHDHGRLAPGQRPGSRHSGPGWPAAGWPSRARRPAPGRRGRPRPAAPSRSAGSQSRRPGRRQPARDGRPAPRAAGYRATHWPRPRASRFPTSTAPLPAVSSQAMRAATPTGTCGRAGPVVLPSQFPGATSHRAWPLPARPRCGLALRRADQVAEVSPGQAGQMTAPGLGRVLGELGGGDPHRLAESRPARVPRHGAGSPPGRAALPTGTCVRIASTAKVAQPVAVAGRPRPDRRIRLRSRSGSARRVPA